MKLFHDKTSFHVLRVLEKSEASKQMNLKQLIDSLDNNCTFVELRKKFNRQQILSDHSS